MDISKKIPSVPHMDVFVYEVDEDKFMNKNVSESASLSKSIKKGKTYNDE